MNQHCNGSHSTPRCFSLPRSEDNLAKLGDLAWEWGAPPSGQGASDMPFQRLSNAIVRNFESPALKRLLFRNSVLYNTKIAWGVGAGGGVIEFFLIMEYILTPLYPLYPTGTTYLQKP